MKTPTLQAEDLLDFTHTAHRELFVQGQPVWAALKNIEACLRKKLQPAMRGTVHPSSVIGENIFIDEGTIVEPGAHIKGPAWIGKNCQVRSGCYIRENVIVGTDCGLGGRVHAEIAWAKLGALVEGARLASKRLWR